ncbi:Peptidyl-prolyl cis-trans isomerase [Seminavis robusta]|uniref:peptidylprolyl isomerase n=1 Tax=Seminavis robusta TaxID=568900 RepID=A0A9N8HYX0_9STRA|nr:Peptidyl-prolyl cis-trans isomerase [Seminavis robusta]|eukprot:Sro3098_g343700.1 Peptidyl-prolyl cis-trans isomerase (229) ;mRNA; f:6496-7182
MEVNNRVVAELFCSHSRVRSGRVSVSTTNDIVIGCTMRKVAPWPPHMRRKRTVLVAAFPSPSSAAAGSNGLPLTTAPSSGLKWADAKVGSGQPLSAGAPASIDYSMASTGGRFPQIYTTKDKGAPYRWKLGDGSTISGVELAILGDEKDGIPPMLPGGIRRVIIPSTLGYESLAAPNSKCEAGKEGSIGPIPPKDEMGFYNRWLQLYCNPRIPYQPDLVFDIKLYGRR